MKIPRGYESLGNVLFDALTQASKGKGKERHAEEDEPYECQVICEVARRLSTDFNLGQAVKKIYESKRLPWDKARAELLGAINYLAAVVIVGDEQ